MQNQECSPGCYVMLYGYHTGDCPNVTAKDRKLEAKNDMAVEYERDNVSIA